MATERIFYISSVEKIPFCLNLVLVSLEISCNYFLTSSSCLVSVLKPTSY
nr:MAG TPA: hypothetical protein [Caudoviricetes sp.]